MSFILDALKKSEAERARQAGPALVDLRVVAPRRGLPGWVFVLGGVLLANLVVLGIVLTRGGREGPAAAATATTSPSTLPPVPPEPRPTNVLPPPSLPPAEDARDTVPPAARYGSSRPAPLPTAQAATVLADAGGGRVITPAAASPPPPAAAASRAAAPRESTAGLPAAEDLRLSGIALPSMSMALHAWDPQPANRYVLINGQKLREGQQTEGGVEVEQITGEGAVMRWREQRFLLTPGD